MKFFDKILNILFPETCLSCQERVSFDANFCAKCWQKLQFIKSPHCQICCYPFEIQTFEIQIIQNQTHNNEHNICANCLKKPPFFDKTISVFRYNELIGKVIGNLKYRDNIFLAKKFAKILLNRALSEINDCDIICAVPLHKNKLKIRKFNQALLIAKHLNSSKLICDLIVRTKDQKAQVKLTQKQRIANIKKSFKVNPLHQNLIKGRKILLIDDVITTLATVNSISKELKKNKASSVVVLSLAKTIFY